MGKGAREPEGTQSEPSPSNYQLKPTVLSGVGKEASWPRCGAETA